MTPEYTLSRGALFVRSAAKLGLWAGALGVAADLYYNSRFISLVLSQEQQEVTPGKLYEKVKGFTVDDGCLAGAGLGLAASVPALLTRRLAIPRWARCVGLVNIGACSGIVGGHGYLHYTGERQTAYARLGQRLEQRSVAFRDLCWNKQVMSRLNPLAQLYIRHNALWYAQQLPDPAFSEAESVDADPVKPRAIDPHVGTTDSTYTHDQSFYAPPFDYLEDLKNFSVEATYEKIVEHEAEIAALLKEADFILYFAARKQYEYCNLGDVEDEERRQRLEELQLLQITHRKLRGAAEQLESRLMVWRIALQHKAIMESPVLAKVPVSAWLPSSQHDFTTHDPALSIWELAQTQEALVSDLKVFEAAVAHPDYAPLTKERRKLDIEDGRSLLRVTDKLVWEFEKMQEAAWKKSLLDQSCSARNVREQKHVAESAGARVDGTTAAKQADKALKVGKS